MKKCGKEDGFCVIGLMGKDKNKNELYKGLQYAKAVMEKRKIQLEFVLVDGLCQHEMRNAFKISGKSIPTLVVYSHSNKKASKLIREFNNADMFKLIEGTLREKIHSIDVDEVAFIERNCEEQFTNNHNIKQEYDL